MNEQRSHAAEIEHKMNPISSIYFIRTSTSYVAAMAAALVVVLSASVALAQTPQAPAKDAPPAGAKPAAGKEGKKTSVNFEDQLIEGQTQKPELFYLLQNRNNNFKRLIKLRENFLPEMRKTAEDVGRKDAGTKGSGE